MDKDCIEFCNSIFKKSPPGRGFGTRCTPVQVQLHQKDGHVWEAGTPWRLCASLAVTLGQHTSYRLTSWAATQHLIAWCKSIWNIEEITSNRRGHPAPGVRIYNSSRIQIATEYELFPPQLWSRRVSASPQPWGTRPTCPPYACWRCAWQCSCTQGQYLILPL